MELTAGKRTFSRRSLHGQVAHELGMRIVGGEFPPGSILPNEAEFSDTLQVSRTVYRESIKVLASKGLIESRPKVGTSVRPREAWNTLDPDILSWIFASGPNEQYAADLFELRRIIEPAAAELAALRHTETTFANIERAYQEMEAAGEDIEKGLDPDLRFHRAIFESTGNNLLTPMVFLIDSALAEIIKMSSRSPGARLNSIPLHKNILEAIRQRDPSAAREATLILLDAAHIDTKHALKIENT